MVENADLEGIRRGLFESIPVMAWRETEETVKISVVRRRSELRTSRIQDQCAYQFTTLLDVCVCGLSCRSGVRRSPLVLRPQMGVLCTTCPSWQVDLQPWRNDSCQGKRKWLVMVVYSCCSRLAHRASVKHFSFLI
jgi:hypothetical protein